MLNIINIPTTPLQFTLNLTIIIPYWLELVLKHIKIFMEHYSIMGADWAKNQNWTG